MPASQPLRYRWTHRPQERASRRNLVSTRRVFLYLSKAAVALLKNPTRFRAATPLSLPPMWASQPASDSQGTEWKFRSANTHSHRYVFADRNNIVSRFERSKLTQHSRNESTTEYTAALSRIPHGRELPSLTFHEKKIRN